MRRGKSCLGAVGIVLAAVGVLAILYAMDALSVLTRAALAFIALILSGLAIQRAMGLNGGYGFYMMGSRKGLRAIDRTSRRYRKFWDAMTMWGLTMGFGLLAYPLVKGRIDTRVFALGVLSSVLIVLFVQPQLAIAFQFINMPRVQTAISSQSSALQQSASLIAYATTVVTAVFGFTGYIFLSILSNAASILIGIARFLLSYASGVMNTSTLSNQIPGVAPIIPGVNIPLIAGIASLAILLAVHELSHGVLARMAGVKLKSLGLLVFGIIPIGAYVEPDERIVKRLGAPKQTRIFTAGIAANFMAMIVFFVLMFLVMYYVAPKAYSYGVFVTGTTPGYPANGVLKSGMQVLGWNGRMIMSVSDLVAAGALGRPNGTILVVTDSGTFLFNAVAQPGNSSKGIIGVELGYRPVLKTLYAKSVYFIYTLFALSMLLNFLVAVVNLLPVPGFDGWRVYKANIKSSRFVNAMAALIVAGILINTLPWVFYI